MSFSSELEINMVGYSLGSPVAPCNYAPPHTHPPTPPSFVLRLCVTVLNGNIKTEREGVKREARAGQGRAGQGSLSFKLHVSL